SSLLGDKLIRLHVGVAKAPLCSGAMAAAGVVGHGTLTIDATDRDRRLQEGREVARSGCLRACDWPHLWSLWRATGSLQPRYIAMRRRKTQTATPPQPTAVGDHPSASPATTTRAPASAATA